MANLPEATPRTAEDLLDLLEQRRAQSPDERPPAELSSEEQARLAAYAAGDKKADELRVLDLSQVSDFTDVFIICSGTNERQVKAISENIESTLRRAKIKPLHIEGFNHGRWVLLDYGGDMVVHVFHREVRDFYDLERLWSDAPDLTEKLAPVPGPAPGSAGRAVADQAG